MVCIYHIWPFQRDSGTAPILALPLFSFMCFNCCCATAILTGELGVPMFQWERPYIGLAPVQDKFFTFKPDENPK